MKLVLKIVGIIFGILLGLFILQAVASESGEVVVVHTTDTNGEVAQTRLWVVDHEGAMWLRSGTPMAGWYQRMQANPNVLVVRAEQEFALTAVPIVAMRDTINQKLNDKYGWADDVIEVFFGRDDAIAIRLDPRSP